MKLSPSFDTIYGHYFFCDSQSTHLHSVNTFLSSTCHVSGGVHHFYAQIDTEMLRTIILRSTWNILTYPLIINEDLHCQNIYTDIPLQTGPQTESFKIGSCCVKSALFSAPLIIASSETKTTGQENVWAVMLHLTWPLTKNLMMWPCGWWVTSLAGRPETFCPKVTLQYFIQNRELWKTVIYSSG